MEKKDKAQQHKHELSRNFKALVVRELFGKVIGFLGQLILARILFPSQFGTYAMLLFVVNVFMLFSNAGLSQIIINHDDALEKNKIGSINTIIIGVNIFLTILVFLASPIIMHAYLNFSSREVYMLKILSFLIFIDGIKSIPTAILERNLHYKIIAITETVGMILYQVIAIFLALVNFDVWSFIFASLIKDTFETVILSYYAQWKPICSFQKDIIKDIKGFGAYIQGSGILSYLATATNPIIAGTQLGSKSVGLLDWANNIISVPESITNNFGRVAFSQFSRIKNDFPTLARISERSLSLLTAITYIIPIILLLYAKELVTILYTPKWLEGLPALYMLSLGIFFYPAIITAGQLLLAIQKAKEVFIINVFATSANWIIAIITVRFFGIIGIAVGLNALSVITAIGYIYTAKNNGLSIHTFAKIAKHVSITFTVLVLSTLLKLVIHQSSLLFTLIEICLTLLMYCILYLIFIRDDVIAIWENIQIFKKG